LRRPLVPATAHALGRVPHAPRHSRPPRGGQGRSVASADSLLSYRVQHGAIAAAPSRASTQQPKNRAAGSRDAPIVASQPPADPPLLAALAKGDGGASGALL